ncbi:MAG: ATP-dependent helicase [Gemmatimonadetes bacterium]|jgi:DNA helicase II / ATP-dependent DNA helicase PcrA|nr:ATP-dependent helicase [Gemmatimonadota bacterium]MBT7860078.1 ATP-dependent helicase [Gemmatimonadota bacterium]
MAESGGFRPRAGQREILAYEGGRLGVAAVPGSGKTATIAALTARLLEQRVHGEGPLGRRGRVLVVTYQNAAVDTLRGRIGARLRERGLPATGYDVRTLHSLSFGLVRAYPGHVGTTTDFRVLDESSTNGFIDRAVGDWNRVNVPVWGRLAPGEGDVYDERWEGQWQRIARSLASTVIASAKNLRLDPASTLRLAQTEKATESQALAPLLVRIGAQIYESYQQQVETSGGIDFNDMVRLAVSLLEGAEDVAARLAQRWPVVLEDEAQDSVPLQEELLGRLTQPTGNWIRVGDPNQSITSTFTSADPRLLRGFLDRADVQAIEMSISGRSAPAILDLANDLVRWTCDRYPLEAIRSRAFRDQALRSTDPGDPQPNPEDAEGQGILFRPFEHRHQELIDASRRAARFCTSQPEMTVAILVPTNKMGFDVAESLRELGIHFDERLQSSRQARSIVDTMARALSLIAQPANARALERAWQAVQMAAGEEDSDDRAARLLRSCYRPEILLAPVADDGLQTSDAFPPVSDIEPDTWHRIGEFSKRVMKWLPAASLPVDQLTMALAHDLLPEDDLATAHEIAMYLRRLSDENPAWRLPELVAELGDAAVGRSLLSQEDGSFEPQPGRITLTTLHKAKGLEWDLVYVLGVDAVEFPASLEDDFRGHQQHLGGDPAQMARVWLLDAADGETSGRDGTSEGRLDTIAERLRLLYVAVTRARRYLSLSYSQYVPVGQRTRRVEPALAFEQLQTLYHARRVAPESSS